MSIHFISGKPGGGKSYLAMRFLVDELRHTKRHIVTNLSVKFEGLNHYMQSEYPKWYETAGPIRERITILQEDDLKAFFTHRGNCVPMRSISKQEWSQGVRTDYSKVRDDGVCYFLDEVHIPFNSRQWAETGPEVLYYLSQHRKLGDDVFCITQFVGNVDKQFRTMTQDYTYVRNLSKEKLGLFKLPKQIVWRLFLEPASGPTVKPMETGTFRLDVDGLGTCYDTAQGVGIAGKMADTSERRKGIHWAVGALGIVVGLCVLGKVVPSWGAYFFTAPMRANQPKAVAVQKTNVVVATNSPRSEFGPTNRFVAPEYAGWIVAVLPELEDGHFIGRRKIVLSDGLELTGGMSNGTVRDFMYAGKTYEWKHTETRMKSGGDVGLMRSRY
jgi:hypothetical protein